MQLGTPRVQRLCVPHSTLDLRSSCWLLSTALVFLVCLNVLRVECGNCTQVPSMVIEREGTLYNITGTHIHVHPKLNGVVQYDVLLGWSMPIFVERAKVTKTWAGTALPHGVFLTGSPNPSLNPVDPMVDPLEPADPNVMCSNAATPTPCGEILNYITTEDMDCWTERFIAPFHGHMRESVYVHFSNAAIPGFQFVSEHHITDGDVSVPMNNTGFPGTEVYSANSLKVGYQWHNYPWVGGSDIAYTAWNGTTYNNGSTFEFWVQYDLVVPYECELTLVDGNLSNSFTVDGVAKPVHLSIDISHVLLMDDVGFHIAGNPNNNVTLHASVGLDLHSQMRSLTNFPFAPHWKSFIFDPSLASLFSPEVPNSSPLPKSKLIWPYVVGALLVVGAIVAAIVLVVLYVPAVTKIVRPFVSRNAAPPGTLYPHAGSPHEANNGNWQRAEFPAR